MYMQEEARSGRFRWRYCWQKVYMFVAKWDTSRISVVDLSAYVNHFTERFTADKNVMVNGVGGA